MERIVENSTLAQHHRPGEDTHEPVRPERQHDEKKQHLLATSSRRPRQGHSCWQTDERAQPSRPQAYLDRCPGDVDEIGPPNESKIVVERKLERAIAERRRLQN